jgi:hypothetical protein
MIGISRVREQPCLETPAFHKRRVFEDSRSSSSIARRYFSHCAKFFKHCQLQEHRDKFFFWRQRKALDYHLNTVA